MKDEQPVPAEFAFLLILRAEGGELSNTEMDRLYRVRLVSPNYEKLNAEPDRLVFTDREHKPYRHRLTPAGLAAISGELPLDGLQPEEGAKATRGGKRARGETKQLFWAAAVAQQRYVLRLGAGRIGPEPIVADPADLAARIRAAYAELAGRPGAWVDLTDLRPLLSDVPKDELDKALVHLLEASEVNLEPDPLRSRVGAAQRAAAVRVDGEDRHKLAIGRP